jgi:hypothetical protein
MQSDFMKINIKDEPHSGTLKKDHKEGGGTGTHKKKKKKVKSSAH